MMQHGVSFLSSKYAGALEKFCAQCRQESGRYEVCPNGLCLFPNLGRKGILAGSSRGARPWPILEGLLAWEGYDYFDHTDLPARG